MTLNQIFEKIHQSLEDALNSNEEFDQELKIDRFFFDSLNLESAVEAFVVGSKTKTLREIISFEKMNKHYCYLDRDHNENQDQWSDDDLDYPNERGDIFIKKTAKEPNSKSSKTTLMKALEQHLKNLDL